MVTSLSPSLSTARTQPAVASKIAGDGIEPRATWEDGSGPRSGKLPGAVPEQHQHLTLQPIYAGDGNIKLPIAVEVSECKGTPGQSRGG